VKPVKFGPGDTHEASDQPSKFVVTFGTGPGGVNKGNLHKDLPDIMSSTSFALTSYTYFISLQKFFGHFSALITFGISLHSGSGSNKSKSVTTQDAKLS
jgi:hypothetical protein